MLYPVGEKFPGDSAIPVSARYGTPGVQALVENSFLPKSMDGLRKKRLKHENGYMPATADQCNPDAGRAFENDVQHYLVVPWVFVVLMMYPINNSAMDFHVAVIGDAAYLEYGIPNIRPSI
jgi:hypothetical protein